MVLCMWGIHQEWGVNMGVQGGPTDDSDTRRFESPGPPSIVCRMALDLAGRPLSAGGFVLAGV